jgi:DNA-binding transcriptional regulator YhcF (GntR family)
MAWKFDSDKAVYLQVADRLRKWVINGRYGPGEQIPTVRQLALDAAVNPNTIQHAFSELEREGLIESRGTLGRFVTENSARIAEAGRKEARELVFAFVDEIIELSISEEEANKLIKEAFDERFRM